MAKITVGRFALDSDTGEFWGPGEYMAEQGNAKLDRILAGNDTVFNMTAHLSPSTEVAILVAMQTDFAGWRGMEQVKGWIRRSGTHGSKE